MFNNKDLEKYRQRLFELLRKDAFRKEQITLSSGKQSSYYIDARTVTLNSEGAFCAAYVILSLVENNAKIKAIGGPTIGADPIVGAIAAVSFLEKRPIKTFIVRKLAKTHGKGKQVEGPSLEPGSEVVIVDDVATTGSSLVEAAGVLRSSGLIVKKAIVLVDRQEGGRENLLAAGLELSSIFTAADFLKS